MTKTLKILDYDLLCNKSGFGAMVPTFGFYSESIIIIRNVLDQINVINLSTLKLLWQSSDNDENYFPTLLLIFLFRN